MKYFNQLLEEHEIELLIKELISFINKDQADWKEIKIHLTLLDEEVKKLYSNYEKGIIDFNKYLSKFTQFYLYLENIITDLSDHLTTDNQTPTTPILDSEKKIILFLPSHCVRNYNLKIYEEFARISYAIQDKKELLEIRNGTHALNLKELQKAILFNDPNIIHFAGRTLLNASKPSGIYTRKNNHNCDPLQLKIEALEKLFSEAKRKVKIDSIILNFGGLPKLAETLVKYVKFVICLPQEIDHNIAIEFAETFYNALSFDDKLDFDFAFNWGKTALLMLGLDDKNGPVLYQNQ